MKTLNRLSCPRCPSRRAEGRPMRVAARRFGVSVSAVKRYVVRQHESGSLERFPIPGYLRRIGKEQEAILWARLEEVVSSLYP